jgi:SpoVK/Ycf46/Vps4 family AAA+-type ATPase
VTDEEDRFLVRLHQTLRDFARRTWVYNAAFGLVPIESLMKDWTERTHTEDPETLNIHGALVKMYKDDPKKEQNFYIVTDPERWLADAHVQRRFLNLAHQVHQDNRVIKIVIFVGTRKYVPEKLARYVEVVHDKGLTDEEILGLVEDAAKHLKTPVPENAQKLFKGLTAYEIKMAIGQSIIATKKDQVNPRRIDPTIVADFRRKQLRKSDLVQYIDTDNMSFDQVGGADRFKEWARKARATWSDRGQKFGLRPPKGVLCVGVWGCGKSLSVKALGAAWGLPVVQLEMGRLRSSGVGDSEANVYRACRIIEAAAPCVTGETEVTLADGTTKPIESLWQTYVAGSTEPLRVQCWNEKSFRVETTGVRAITRREAEAFRVEAAHGFYLNATANHQHYVMRGGMPEWVRTDELQPGDMMAVPTAQRASAQDEGVDPDAVLLQCHPSGMRTYGPTNELRRGGGGYRDAVVPKLPVKWTWDLGRLLGLIEGDGFIGEKDGIGFTNTSPTLLSRFEGFMEGLFGLKPSRNEHKQGKIPNLPGLSDDPQFKPCWTSVVQNQLAAEFLRNARRAILSAPVGVRAAFLAGWIDADGCIGPNKVTLTVKHPKMWAERQLLARQVIQSLGVVPSKFGYPNLEITGSRAVRLASLIGEFLMEKSAKAALVSSSEIGFDRNMGYACGQVLAQARAASGLTLAQIGMSPSTVWNHENGRVPISRRHLYAYMEKLGDAGQDLRRLSRAECEWIKVMSVEPIGVQTVYDLACEGEDTHSFIANGLVTHNCIVWIDEAEKSLSGAASSAQSDAGTTNRTIGILSTWLQETDAQVCLAMTANSLKTLPVEFVNRMDERFFFDIPDEEGRIEILKIHLRKAGQDPDQYDLATLADKAQGMVGREIEQAIGAAMIESFAQDKPALDTDILTEELAHKPRIIKTMADEVKEIVEWVGYDPDANDGIRARFASKPDRKSGGLKLVSPHE